MLLVAVHRKTVVVVGGGGFCWGEGGGGVSDNGSSSICTVFYQKGFSITKRSKVFIVLHLCYVKDWNFLTIRGRNGIFL